MCKRKTNIIRNYLVHPAGSVLIETGKTKVICTVTVEENIPPFLRDQEIPQGWLTAEYSMLPGATNVRFRRERGKTNSRSSEIQRLIGRSLRSVIDLTRLPGLTLLIDCDVIQADGGTRTASITGACVALYDAVQKLKQQGLVFEDPFQEWVAAISVGIVDDEVVADLDYEQDSRAEVDLNVVMTESGKFVELQGTAEKKPFSAEQLQLMLNKAKTGIAQLIKLQKQMVK